MIPTNPVVASVDDGFEYSPSCICWALGRCFTLYYDNIGQNHSNIPYYHGHFKTSQQVLLLLCCKKPMSRIEPSHHPEILWDFHLCLLC